MPRNPRARHLWDKWRHVWMMAWERQRRLQDKLAYLQELEKVKNFSWDDWRRRVFTIDVISANSPIFTMFYSDTVHEVYEPQEIARDRFVPQDG